MHFLINDSNQSEEDCRLWEAREPQHHLKAQGNHQLGSAKAERISPCKIRRRADSFPTVWTQAWQRQRVGQSLPSLS